MATLRAIRSRITSVGKIRKITNALEIVALTRLRRMERDAIASRDYFDRIRNLLFDVASSINFKSHPFLLEPQSVKTVGIISIFSDKGLCGDFNANVGGKLLGFISTQKEKRIKLVIVGKKGLRRARQNTKCELLGSYPSAADKETLEKGILDIAQRFVEGFLGHDIDEMYLLYSKFRLHLLGEVKIIKLLPFIMEKEGQGKTKQGDRDYIYEPSPYEIFDSLVREYIVNQIRHGILESRCAEEMSRMLAMKSAAENSDEIIDKLTLQYNKSRQAQITKELTEVIAAAEVTV